MTDLTKVIPSAAAIHKAGGPRFPEWCELYKHKQPYGPDDWVEEMRIWSSDQCDAAYNHEACEAAVIAYAGEVLRWWNSSRTNGGRKRLPEELLQLAASVALIEAVAGEVGDNA